MLRSSRAQVCYRYDGSFAGFLCCVWESFAEQEEPCLFFAGEEEQYSIYPCRQIETDEDRAKRVYRALGRQLPPGGQELYSLAFLTCLEERELHIYRYLHANLSGERLTDLTDDRVLVLSRAVRHLQGEVELLMGFVRFSDYGGVLVGEISPKNRVLPLLRTHFCQRLPKEAFLLHDKTHGEALLSEKGRWKIVPLDDLQLNETDQREEHYRALWRRFYDTIAIEARYNPKLRMSNMPKRYWAHMTELQG